MTRSRQRGEHKPPSRTVLDEEDKEVRRITVDVPPRHRPLTLPHDAVDAAITSLAEDGHLGEVEVVVDGCMVAVLDMASELKRIAAKPPTEDDDDDDDD